MLTSLSISSLTIVTQTLGYNTHEDLVLGTAFRIGNWTSQARGMEF